MSNATTSSNYVTPPLLLCDMYKLSHLPSYPKGTRKVYSTWTARSNKYMPIVKKVVVFGVQGFIRKYLVDYFNDNFFSRNLRDIVAEYVEFRQSTLFEKEVYTQHIVDLHNLGYLPLEIKALDEGTLAPLQVPIITVENTHPDFFWLTNFVETLMSNEIWQPMTSASYSYAMRKLLDKYALETVGHTKDVAFQGHDFSMRGMSSVESSMTSGAGHLLSFVGTDNIPSIFYAKKYYDASYTNYLLGTSIPATEHSVMTALTPTDGDRDEYNAYRYLITEVFPSGLVSLVSDSYDFWKVIGETIPALKEEIMNRDGKVVIRPDSGDPVDVLCGLPHYKIDKDLEEVTEEELKQIALEVYKKYLYFKIEHLEDEHGDSLDVDSIMFYVVDVVDGQEDVGIFCASIYDNGYDWEKEEFDYDVEFYGVEDYVQAPTVEEVKGLIESLWNTFGGTVSEQGYKVLDSHIGAIYGDSITYERAKEICRRLKDKGFASTNVVFGMGSMGFQFRSRDSLGFAMKATFADINGEDVMLMKDPKTDSKKKSQRGKVAVMEDVETGELFMLDGYGNSETDTNFINKKSLLTTVFKNGKLVKEDTFLDIRKRLHDWQ